MFPYTLMSPGADQSHRHSPTVRISHLAAGCKLPAKRAFTLCYTKPNTVLWTQVLCASLLDTHNDRQCLLLLQG